MQLPAFKPTGNTLERRKNERYLPYPVHYVNTKITPSRFAEEKWKWAEIGEILLCAKILTRPILYVAPDNRRNLAATIYLPSDSNYRVSIPVSLFVSFINIINLYYRILRLYQEFQLVITITIHCSTSNVHPTPIVINLVNNNHFEPIIRTP